jgi:hypothetical protein
VLAGVLSGVVSLVTAVAVVYVRMLRVLVACGLDTQKCIKRLKFTAHVH